MFSYPILNVAFNRVLYDLITCFLLSQLDQSYTCDLEVTFKMQARNIDIRGKYIHNVCRLFAFIYSSMLFTLLLFQDMYLFIFATKQAMKNHMD